MNDYTNEHEQWEAIKNWCQKNAAQWILIIAIGLTVGFGWRYWEAHQLEKKEQASQLFDQLLAVQTADPNSAMIARISSELEKDYSHTVYASLAALFEAKSAALKGDLVSAQQKLNWALQHAKTPALREITRIRLARVLFADKKPDQAMAILEKTEHKDFAAAIEQVKGDIYQAQGKTAQARTAYQNALNAMPISEPLHAYVEMQLNHLPE